MSTIYLSVLNSNEKNLEESPFHPTEKHVRPLFGKPVEIGCFSVDSNSVVHDDNRLMKYLVLPHTNSDIYVNLNENLDLDAHRNYVTLEKMHNTLKWFLRYQSLKDHKAKCFDFITVRGTLKLISCTSYLKGFYRHEWEVCASKFEGTIYFAAIDTDADIEDSKNLTQRQARLQAWGYKFEQFMTADTVDRKCNPDSRRFQMEEFCIVMKNILGRYNILYSAEIDAAIPHRYPGPGSGNTACYTELKTSKEIENEGGRYYFLRYKLVTWWAQSFLCGIPEIICGLRNDDGIVNKLEVFHVSTLPEKAMGLWSPDACLSFCVKFLDFLKRTITEDDANVVYKFYYKGEDTIYCTKIIGPSARYRVIPDWFVEGIKKSV